MQSILVIMNNYFHDVATATLLASAVILYVLGRNARKGGEAELAAFRRAYATLTKFAWGALIWILLGGVPRVIFFTRYEWDPAVIKGIVPALIVKHTLMFLAVIIGAVMWVRMSRELRGAEREGR